MRTENSSVLSITRVAIPSPVRDCAAEPPGVPCGVSVTMRSSRRRGDGREVSQAGRSANDRGDLTRMSVCRPRDHGRDLWRIHYRNGNVLRPLPGAAGSGNHEKGRSEREQLFVIHEVVDRPVPQVSEGWLTA